MKPSESLFAAIKILKKNNWTQNALVNEEIKNKPAYCALGALGVANGFDVTEADEYTCAQLPGAKELAKDILRTNKKLRDDFCDDEPDSIIPKWNDDYVETRGTVIRKMRRVACKLCKEGK